MRKCWNWQTGMTKDHVTIGREGSSPFFRMNHGSSERMGRLLYMPLTADVCFGDTIWAENAGKQKI